MRVAIHQPNYAPWCGFFAKMRRADVFIFLDDVQMPIGRSYVSRMQIMGAHEATWLTIPVRRSAGELINDVQFATDDWATKHLKTLRHTYARVPLFAEVLELIESTYNEPGESLGLFNSRLSRAIAAYLGLPCKFEASSQIGSESTAGSRLVELTHKVGGTVYISGKGGQNYQEPREFAEAGITLEVCEYTPVPYRQSGQSAFVAGLSILDALFNEGRGATRLLQYTDHVS